MAQKLVSSFRICFVVFIIFSILTIWRIYPKKFSTDIVSQQKYSAIIHKAENTTPETKHLKWKSTIYLTTIVGSPDEGRRLTTPLPLTLNFISVSKKTTMPPLGKKIYLQILKTFDASWRRRMNLRYILYAGTLLGAMRHQGFIPYDDDVDLLISELDAKKMLKVINGTSLSIGYQGNKIKLFFKSMNGTNKTSFGWFWPFLDIFTFHRNAKSSGIPYINDLTFTNFRLPESAIFPTRNFLFEGHMLPGPRCPHLVLRHYYGNDYMTKCCPTAYNHRYEKFNRPQVPCISCELLKPYFPKAVFKTSFEPDPEDCHV